MTDLSWLGIGARGVEAAFCCILVLAAIWEFPAKGWCGVKDDSVLVQVRFEKGVTALDDRARQEITRKLAVLRSSPASRLVVGGCPSGGEPPALHEARCRAVREFLLQLHFDAARVRMASTCRIKRDAVPGGGEIITIVRE